MFGNEFALAVSLLVAPVGTPVPSLEDCDWLQLQSAIHRVAIDWEIMDQREKKYLVVNQRDLQDDVDNLRQRWSDLQGAPKIADATRFPDRNIINRMIEENRAVRRDIDQRQYLETDRASGFRSAMYEIDEIHEVWTTLQRAKCEIFYVDVRRKALKKLLNLLGTEAYAAAILPPPVPTWRFGK
jgi:hypothetical protein